MADFNNILPFPFVPLVVPVYQHVHPGAIENAFNGLTLIDFNFGE